VPTVSDFRYLVVPHTHWDREWYLPFEEFRLRLATVLDGVLDALEQDESFRSFTLDGQAIVLEDYLDLRPEHEGRLRALLAAGRLEAGPWYVLADELLVGSESLVRNLLLGRRVCRRFGVEPTRAGYAPDSFGHPAQLPQLLAGFGIETFLFSRGLGDQLDEAGVIFRWHAGGADVTACQMLPHYDNFARLASANDAGRRIDRIVERFSGLLERAGCDTILLANGSDHLPVQPELPEICTELERRTGAAFRIGRFSDFAPSSASLPSYHGELVGSRLQNVLRGVNSARIYLKQANEAAERRLLCVETVAALRSLRTGSAFPAADLRLAWRDLLRNHPHDSICGCSCDEVHRDMLVRYEQLGRTLGALEREALGEREAFVNPLPYARARLVEHRGGTAVVALDGFEGRAVELPPAAPSRSAGGTTIANDVFEVEARPDGTLTVTDLRDGRRFSGLHVVEDEPDLGDLYTFCPGGPVRYAEPAGARVLRDGPLVSELLVEASLPGIGIRTVIRLVEGVDRVELRTTVENDAADHRLRVLFPVGADVEEARAESQFAVVHRPLEPPPPAAPWVEPPVATAHTLGAVALGHLGLLTKGLPEYEAAREGLHLTLLRCVGTISRPPELPTRPAAAGPDLATPDGQCIGTHEFEYALRFDADRLSDAALVRAAQDYRTDFLIGDPFDPPLTVEGDAVFSCLKGSETGDGLALRLFNPNREPVRAGVAGIRSRRLRLDEEVELGEDGASFVLDADEIATLRLRQ
jgi:alpha-mannosidase